MGSLIFVLITVPMILRLIGLLQGLQVSEDGTHFRGRYRRWKLSSVTGRVLGANTVTSVYRGIRTDPSTGQSSYYGSTNVQDTIRLQTADGNQRDLHLLNYAVSVQSGDVISIWYANRGRKGVTSAVLNHTTRQQNINSADLFRILDPRASGYLAFYGFASVFLGPFIVWVPLLVLYFLCQKRARSKFANSNIASLWRLSEPEAQRFAAPWR